MLNLTGNPNILGTVPNSEAWDVIKTKFLSPKFNNSIIVPGLVDVHVHLREPGFSYKETIKTGTLAAAHGGFTAVCPMPNLDPVPDSAENLQIQLDIIKKDACVRVIPYGAITVSENGERLSDMRAIYSNVVGFSDDGRGVQNADVMLAAMNEAKRLSRPVAAHCEDNSLLTGGYIHDGEYARRSGHAGISSESEWKQVERDIELVKKTGCKYHVCHVSTAESVELIRRAKRDGLDVSGETAPHYLVFTDNELQEDGRFKMNPPLRSAEDRAALIDGIKDGTIEIIATDHAPHSAEEKARGLAKSPFGIVGLETAFSVLYTNLVKNGVISLERLVALMSTNPAKRFNIDIENDFAIFDTERPFKIDPAEFLSMGKATPFAGMEVYGKCLMTVCRGRIVYLDKSFEI